VQSFKQEMTTAGFQCLPTTIGQNGCQLHPANHAKFDSVLALNEASHHSNSNSNSNN
jgi:hypothetical protein